MNRQGFQHVKGPLVSCPYCGADCAGEFKYNRSSPGHCEQIGPYRCQNCGAQEFSGVDYLGENYLMYSKEECSIGWHRGSKSTQVRRKVPRFWTSYDPTSQFHEVNETLSNGARELRKVYTSCENSQAGLHGYISAYGKFVELDSSPEASESNLDQPAQRSLGMNHSTAIFLVNPDAARAVRCAYELDGDGKPSKLYTFKTVLRDLAVGDIVVVPTDTRVGFTCVQVAELDIEPDLDSGIQYKWIVAKVDREEYNRICAAEGEMISKIKRAEVRKKREDLANSLFKDQEALKAELQSTVALALPAQGAKEEPQQN